MPGLANLDIVWITLPDFSHLKGYSEIKMIFLYKNNLKKFKFI